MLLSQQIIFYSYVPHWFKKIVRSCHQKSIIYCIQIYIYKQINQFEQPTNFYLQSTKFASFWSLINFGNQSPNFHLFMTIAHNFSEQNKIPILPILPILPKKPQKQISIQVSATNCRSSCNSNPLKSCVINSRLPTNCISLINKQIFSNNNQPNYPFLPIPYCQIFLLASSPQISQCSMQIFNFNCFMIRKEELPTQLRERYSSQPKNKQKFLLPITNKLTLHAKYPNYKTEQSRLLTIENFHEDNTFESPQKQRNNTVTAQLKRKSFVVSRRKKYKLSSNLPLIKNQWITNIQYQTYQGLRQYNQDRILIKQNIPINNNISIDLFAIFDGHGGSSVSQYLKLNFLTIFTLYLKTNQIRDTLLKTLIDLQSKILQSGIKLNSGSCATILVLKDNQFWTANIGDSRIIIIKDHEQWTQITEDHKPENPNEKNRIQKLGGKIYRVITTNQVNGDKYYGPYRVHPSKLSVSRSLGDYLIKKNQTQKLIISQPSFTTGKLTYSDVIILMSDGAYEKFSNNQISIIFANNHHQNLKTQINNYFYQAKKKNTNDNVSLIAIQIKQKKYHKFMEISTDNSSSSYQKIDHCDNNKI